MISIGICDDEEIHRKYVKELCECYFSEYVQEHEYVEFNSGEEVLEYNGNKLHLLFLDVEMDGINGIEVMKCVENAEWIWRIVFISSHDDAVWKSFSIKTLEFARKPIEYFQIKKWLEIAIRENKENIVFEFVSDNGLIHINIEDIYYLKAEGNYTELYGKNFKTLINNNLKKWQMAMENLSVIRIHKSYIINLSHIRKWNSESVMLDNGDIIPIGRKFSKIAKDAYNTFIRKKAVERM